MRGRRRPSWLVLWLGLGTAGGPLVADPPAAPAALPAVVGEARALLRAHRAGEALARLESDGGLSVAAPERSWMLTQLRPAFVGLSAARAAVERLPRSPLRTALDLLLAEDARRAHDEMLPRMRRVRDPWTRLAFAQIEARLGEHDAAARWARAARVAAPPFVALEALQLEARSRLELGDVDGALAGSLEAVRLAPTDPRPRALAAEALRRAGRRDDAVHAALEALALAPSSESSARRLAELLRDDEDASTDGPLEARVRALPLETNPEGLALRALLDDRGGRHAAALEGIERALAAGAEPVPLERERRALLARLGRWATLAEALCAAVPEELRERPGNLLAERWGLLARAAREAAAASDPGAAEAAHVALARALVGLGALREARAALAGRVGDAARALDLRVAGHLALEAALKAEVEAGYRRAVRHQPTIGIDELLARLAAAARRHLVPEERAAFLSPQIGLRRVPPLGDWLDHRARSASPVVAHFRAYGRYLVLGQRSGQPCEAIVLALGVLQEAAPLVTRGRAYRHDFALGYDRALRSYLDMQGGGLAGACLPDGLWLDADAALAAEHDARTRLRRDPSVREAALRLPVPAAHGPDGPFGLADQAGVQMRLLARYAARDPGGRWGSLATLHAHENGHVIDIRRHLPFWAGLPATFALLASTGFSMSRAEAVLERRAQLAAVVDAPDPDLALAEMIELLPAEEREPEAHAAGYRDGLARLVRHVWSRPDLYPEIDRGRRVLPQLDRLSAAQLRGAARAVADG